MATSASKLANQTPSFELTRLIESLLQEFALFLKIILEFIAISIIAISLAIALQQLWQKARRRRLKDAQQAIRLELGLSLALSLEFLLAADIAATAVSPSWDAIARLAAITGIRTFLNFFLQKEVRELEAMNQQIRENSSP
ncbi:MAG: DUF1622 domain-containing protein [Leptolyngbyaceae cyanobacterium CAN_BIN12]|nr:DUF1622 domain-containing protein [Leptolyngbyaceae cyanobacterium CAN_BIN12]